MRQTRQASNLWRDSTSEAVKSGQLSAGGKASGAYVNSVLTHHSAPMRPKQTVKSMNERIRAWKNE